MSEIKMTLKALRINNNYTQQEAGEKLGVTKDTISRWENARSFPDAMQIKAIEKLYNVTYNNIIFLGKNNA
ncbi:helix-turn-helix transcriptional regulator [uncultured Anaerococcus sp.]|uniref:helix-turn-helix domain-containing protein n=1 Tax=uncultured Anaerococcus sp. TaxID=293428 RepID=UPI00280AD398|nr:helix-turn-helix transcriptional regulator [uncultured Anaerococcus sp.]